MVSLVTVMGPRCYPNRDRLTTCDGFAKKSYGEEIQRSLRSRLNRMLSTITTPGLRPGSAVISWESIGKLSFSCDKLTTPSQGGSGLPALLQDDSINHVGWQGGA